MRYEIELKGVAEFMEALAVAPADLDFANIRAMEKSVLVVEAEAKSRTPRRTGRLFSSIDGHVSGAGTVEGRVGTDVSYARFVEFGTDSHEIAATHGGALRFEIGGTFHFASRVRHPGSRAVHYLGEALEASRDYIVDFFKESARELVTDLAGR